MRTFAICRHILYVHQNTIEVEIALDFLLRFLSVAHRFDNVLPPYQTRTEQLGVRGIVLCNEALAPRLAESKRSNGRTSTMRNRSWP